MAIRLSGLVSGMDTESVIRELMKAESLKTTKVENKITTIEWKQEKWSALNSKIYSFYTNQLSKMRFESSYAVKKASSSNASKVEVTAGTSAPEGTHLVKVKQMASSQFLTGAQLKLDDNGNEINAATKLVDLGFDAAEGTTIHIKTAKNQVDLDIRENTTVGEFVNSLRDAGLNANYDSNQKRFFISSKASGVENEFEISTSSTELVQDKNAIKRFLNYDSLSSEDKGKVDGYLNEYLNDTLTDGDRDVIKGKLLEVKHNQVRDSYINDYMSNQANIDAATESIKNNTEGEPLDEEALKVAVREKLEVDAKVAVTNEYDAWENKTATATNIFKIEEDQFQPLIADYATDSGKTIIQNNSLSTLGLGEVTRDAEGTIVNSNAAAILVKAADAIIIYNEAELTGSSNNFTANGLNFTLKGVTAGLDTEETSDDEVISLSVSKNTEAVYDMVKDFVKSYNEILTEMNESYNAASNRSMKPLTDEEKDTMTDDQITKFEDKIKTSLLRRDNTLSSLLTSFRTTLNESVNVNGKTYALSSFGISSQSYKDRGVLQIEGDKDSTTLGLDNKLMDALTNNPEELMNVMTKLSDDLYSSLMDKMKSTTLSSALTVYNDKEMSKTLTNYKDDLKTLEKKLANIEDRYYKQFSAMEVAMSKMNSQSSALASMLGMNTNSQ